MTRSVTVALRAQVADYMSKLGAAAQATRKFGGELDDLGKKSPGKLNDISLAAGALGAALLGVAGYAVKAAMEFDKQMSEVSAVSGATGHQLQALRDLAIQTGQDTQFSATDAAKAEAELAKAGMSVANIMGGGLKGAVSLAAAGQMDLADAATITAQTLNTFQLEGNQASHVADLLAGAANTSAADMHGLGLGLQQVGLVAHQAGWSLEETTGVLAAFADRGLAGSDGATSLKTAILRLMNPTDQVRALLDNLGIELYDASGHMVNAAGLAGQLQAALRGLTEEERNTVLATIFGSDAIRAGTVLYNLGSIGVEHYTRTVDQNGAAAATAAAKMNNLAGDLEQLKGSLETVAIQAGSGTANGLRMLTQTATDAVNWFGQLPGPIQTTATVIFGVSGMALLAAAGFVKVRATALEALAALEAMGPAGEKAAGGLRSAAGWAGKIGVAGLVAFGLYEGTKAWFEFLNHDTKAVTRNVDEMSRALDKFASTGWATGELVKAFGADLENLASNYNAAVKKNAELSTGLKNTGSGLADLGHAMAANQAEMAGLNDKQRKSVNQSQENFQAMDKALADMVSKGGTTQAKLAFEQLAQKWTEAGLPLTELTRLLPEYNKAMDGAAAANSGAAKGFGDTAATYRTLGQSLEASVTAGQKLTDVLKQLSGGHASFIEGSIKANKAVQDLKDSLVANGTTLDLNTEKGRANMQSILDVRSAAIEAAQAKYEESGSVADASAVWDGYVTQLRKTLHDAGLTDTQINQLTNDLFKMPPSITSAVNVPGLIDAISNARSLSGLLNSLDGKVARSQVITTYYANQVGYRPGTAYSGGPIPQRWGGAWEHAAVGRLREAATYTPANPGRYMIAEPQTGGEAFIPKHGDYGRSMAILQHAAGWYGASVMQGGRGSGPVINVGGIVVQAVPGVDGGRIGAEIVEKIRQYERTNGAGWRRPP